MLPHSSLSLYFSLYPHSHREYRQVEPPRGHDEIEPLQHCCYWYAKQQQEQLVFLAFQSAVYPLFLTLLLPLCHSPSFLRFFSVPQLMQIVHAMTTVIYAMRM